MTPAVVAIHAGPVRDERFADGRARRTAICKSSRRDLVRIGPLGIEGDDQADRRHHGGASRALCAYVLEHQRVWAGVWKRDVPPGSFGENLTVSGLDETTVHIGDRFRLGSALIEVASARGPCGTLAARLGIPDVVAQVRARGWTGWYSRVLEPGEAQAGDALVLESAHPAAISVAEAYRIKLDKQGPAGPTRRLLAVEALCPEWRASLTDRLAALGA
jgi:MOSC domain-containing protein YiiM